MQCLPPFRFNLRRGSRTPSARPFFLYLRCHVEYRPGLSIQSSSQQGVYSKSEAEACKTGVKKDGLLRRSFVSRPAGKDEGARSRLNECTFTMLLLVSIPRLIFSHSHYSNDHPLPFYLSRYVQADMLQGRSALTWLAQSCCPSSLPCPCLRNPAAGPSVLSVVSASFPFHSACPEDASYAATPLNTVAMAANVVSLACSRLSFFRPSLLPGLPGSAARTVLI